MDELIRSNSSARNNLMELEDLTDKELDMLHSELCERKKDTEEHINLIVHTKHKKTKEKHSNS